MSIYEAQEVAQKNKDIEAMVTHAVMSFPDGTREAVLAYNQIKDGKVIRLETGATLLP